MQWLKLHLSLARSPALLTVSLAARGSFFQLFLAASDEGRIDVPNGATHEDVVRALLHDPSDETAPTRTLLELTTRGLVIATDDALVVPARLGIDREGRAAGGVGSRGGRSAAERKRDSRAKRVTGPVTEDVTTPVTGSVTGDVTGSVTGDVTVETVTGHSQSQDDVTGHMATQTLENKALANNVTASVTVGHSAREDKNREDKNREEEGKKKRDGVTGQTVTPPSAPLVLSSESTEPTKPRRLPTPQPKLPWSIETMCERLSMASCGRVVTTPFPRQLASPVTAVVRELEGAGCTLDDVALVGEWIANGGLSWMADGIGVSWIAKAGALVEAIGKARVWRDGGKRAITAQGNRPAPVQRGPVPAAPASAFPDVDRLQAQREIDANRAEIDAARRAQRIGGVR